MESQVKKPYEQPELRELGSLLELTAQYYNKIGVSPDMYSTNPEVVGSVVPIP